MSITLVRPTNLLTNGDRYRYIVSIFAIRYIMMIFGVTNLYYTQISLSRYEVPMYATLQIVDLEKVKYLLAVATQHCSGTLNN